VTEHGGAVLVTGMPRTATSWVGKMLEASGRLVYVSEPLNPRHPPGRSPGVLRAEVTHAFQYISEENERVWLPAFRDTVRLRFHLLAELRRNHRPYDLARAVKYAAGFALGRLRGRRALLDDPYAVFAAPWLHRRVGCRVVVTVRDPVATGSSWRRLGWRPRLAELLAQPPLVRDRLGRVGLAGGLDLGQKGLGRGGDALVAVGRGVQDGRPPPRQPRQPPDVARAPHPRGGRPHPRGHRRRRLRVRLRRLVS
jgi:hypothetical protein